MRKVRCDVMLRTPPCTNCSLDGVECRTAGTLPRRPPQKRDDGLLVISPAPSHSSQNYTTLSDEGYPVSLKSPPAVATPARDNYPHIHRRVDNSVSQPPRADREGYLKTVLSADESGYHLSSDLGRSVAASGAYPQHPVYPAPNNVHSQKDTYLPDYIQSFPVQRPEDLEYLRGRGVFELLPPDIQVRILDQFEQFIYPMVPMFDIWGFRGAMCGTDQRHKIPLILYHAVMFLGLGLMDNDFIMRFLYTTKSAAREVFYQKTKALYDLNMEPDRMVLCQVSILLVERTDSKDVKNYSVWIGNAISHAHDLKLYRQEPDPPSPSICKRNWRKILWWTILIKECILCMGVPQPPRIWPFSTPPLTLSDFAIEDVALSSIATEAQALQTPAATLAWIYIFRAKMFNQMFHSLRMMHEGMGGFSGRPFSGPLPSFRQTMHRQLCSWHSEVPLAWWIGNLVSSGIAETHPSVAWSMAVTEFLYWTAHIIIYKDEMLVELSPHTKPDFMAENASEAGYTRQLLQHAANCQIDVLRKALACNIGHFFPPAFLHGIFMAAAVQIRDAAGPDPDLRQRGICNLNVCIEISNQLLDKAPAMVGVVEKMEQTVQILIERSSHERQGNTPPDLVESAYSSSIIAPASGLGAMTPRYISGGDKTILQADASNGPEDNGDPDLAFGRHVFISLFPEFEI
ncbi:hypothetical protein BJY01DRAFT_246302 [Aspergillus pseudoustus]|uniref:Xylanolytic transcriptional activator regulatory domain-containing protein n=1 Tax=Aspergillus pseudoustus TaxID=1810923 RepID=A0ABR4K8G1_9EURO